MKLWTFQSAEVENWLEKQSVFRAEWKFTPLIWRPSYQWMAEAMESHGIALNGFAPVWAWHSCREWRRPPTVETALMLLTDYQLLNGMVVIEMEAPDELCLLSTYSRFNDLLNEVIDEGAVLYPQAYSNMFQLPVQLNGDDIQAVLPCIDMDWVTDIRAIDIKPGKSDYDPEILL